MYVLNSVINLMLEKMKNNRYTNWFFAAVVVAAGFSMAACEDEPDKYEVAGGKPILKYVRGEKRCVSKFGRSENI